MTFAAAAGALGVLAGIAFGWLWLWVVPWAVHRRFWRAMSSLMREILGVEEIRAFLGLYRRLLGLVARYVGRNLGGTVVASVPLIAVLLVASRVVDDGEVAFFAAFIVAMTVVFLWPGRKAS